MTKPEMIENIQYKTLREKAGLSHTDMQQHNISPATTLKLERGTLNITLAKIYEVAQAVSSGTDMSADEAFNAILEGFKRPVRVESSINIAGITQGAVRYQLSSK